METVVQDPRATTDIAEDNIPQADKSCCDHPPALPNQGGQITTAGSLREKLGIGLEELISGALGRGHAQLRIAAPPWGNGQDQDH